jgi:peptide/nickel transport system substrate-binding protein
MERRMRVSSSRRNMYIAIVVIVIIVVAGVGVGLYLTAPKTTIQNPGKIVVDTYGEPYPGVDPAIDYETAGGEIIQNCYDTLLFYNLSSISQLNYVLCQNYSVSRDGLTYTFNLRQGITFTDGTPFNASAMKWSLDRAILIDDPSGPAWILAQAIRGGWNYYQAMLLSPNNTATYKAALAYLEADGVQVTGTYQLVIHVNYHDNSTPAPFPAFPYCLAMTVASCVSPSYVFANDGVEGNKADASTNNITMSVAQYNHTFNGAPAPSAVPFTDGRGIIPNYSGTTLYPQDCLMTHTAGTGPYSLTSWVSGVGEVMDYVPNYWGGPHNTGPASIHEVVLNDVPSFTTRELAIEGGSCDVAVWVATSVADIYNMTSSSVLPQYASTISVTTGIKTLEVEDLMFNQAPYLTVSSGSPVIICTGVNHTAAGYGNTSYHDQVCNSSLNPFQYPDFRKAVIDCFNFSAYYAEQNGLELPLNGFLPDGMTGYNASIPAQTNDTTLATALFNKVGWNGTINVYYNTGNTERDQCCEILQAQIAQYSAGRVSVNIMELTWPAYLALWESFKLPVGDIGWLPDYPAPDDYAFPYAMPSGCYAFFDSMSAPASIQNDYVTATTTLNATTASIDWSKIVNYVNSQSWYLWTAQGVVFHVQRTWIHGYFYNPLFNGLIYYDLSKY